MSSVKVFAVRLTIRPNEKGRCLVSSMKGNCRLSRSTPLDWIASLRERVLPALFAVDVVEWGGRARGGGGGRFGRAPLAWRSRESIQSGLRSREDRPPGPPGREPLVRGCRPGRRFPGLG